MTRRDRSEGLQDGRLRRHPPGVLRRLSVNGFAVLALGRRERRPSLLGIPLSLTLAVYGADEELF